VIGQNSDVDIFSEIQALDIIDKQGIDSLTRFTNPINLIYLNKDNAKFLIDKKFSEGFIKQHPDSSGIFTLRLPKYSIEIAKIMKDDYAAQKVFEYYKSLPKHIKSDTVFVYLGLDEILSLLVFYKPEGLEKTLISDYYEWEKLAQKSTPKKHKTFEELRLEFNNKPYDNIIALSEDDLYVDCNYVTFQIAQALNKLGHSDFNRDKLLSLEAKQTFPYIKNYNFPIFVNQNLNERLFVKNYKVIDLGAEYKSIKTLVEDHDNLVKILYKKIDNCCGSELLTIIYDDKSKAYVEFIRDNGLDAYIIKLKKDKLLIQNVRFIIE